MATVRDDRKDKSKPWGFIVCEDAFLGRWGREIGTVGKTGRSLYILAVDGPREAQVVVENAKRRKDMKRVRYVQPTKEGLPATRLRKGDHVAIVDKHEASRWYEPGAFGEG
jgi:hypothetical protein